MRHGPWRVPLLAAAALVLAAAGALAQRRSFFFGELEPQPEPVTARYDGRFTFTRLAFTTGPGGYYYRRLPAWAHGYPHAERNLVQILNEVSLVNAHLDDSNVIPLDGADLFNNPVAFMTEAGFWEMTDREAASFRAYLEKGGFVIFDDFRVVPYDHGGGGWDHFEDQMRRVLPAAQFLDLDPTHPIFHAFFDIDSFDIVPQSYDAGAPIFRGVFEDNDPSKRMMAMINLNTDVSDFWEFSATGYVPVEASNEAYKLGVNYIMYELTH